MRIAIVGCGIGGLATASFLADAGHDIIVFDQFEKSAAVGSGLVIQPVGLDVLKKLNIADDVLSKGACTYQMLGIESSSGARVLDVAYGEQGGQDFGLGIHRASLFDALMKAAQKRNVQIEHSSKVTSSSLTDGIRYISLERGMQMGPYDLVVDTSGAQSVLSPLNASELQFGAIWGTVDWPKNTTLKYNQLEQRYHKAQHMIGILPIGTLPNEHTPKAALFWSIPKQDYALWCATPIEEWQYEAETLWPELAPFIRQITSHDQMTMAHYTHGQLYKPYAERLVYIGDSAHRASPQLGQGANMALLDAYALTKSLEKYPLNTALANYAKSRRYHVMIYQAMSWMFTPMYQSNSRIFPFLRDRVLAPLSVVSPIKKVLTSIVKGTMINACKGID